MGLVLFRIMKKIQIYLLLLYDVIKMEHKLI
jgi:hypothetical protein